MGQIYTDAVVIAGRRANLRAKKLKMTNQNLLGAKRKAQNLRVGDVLLEEFLRGRGMQDFKLGQKTLKMPKPRLGSKG